VHLSAGRSYVGCASRAYEKCKWLQVVCRVWDTAYATSRATPSRHTHMI